eukprot:161288_1
MDVDDTKEELAISRRNNNNNARRSQQLNKQFLHQVLQTPPRHGASVINFGPSTVTVNNFHSSPQNAKQEPPKPVQDARLFRKPYCVPSMRYESQMLRTSNTGLISVDHFNTKEHLKNCTECSIMYSKDGKTIGTFNIWRPTDVIKFKQCVLDSNE